MAYQFSMEAVHFAFVGDPTGICKSPTGERTTDPNAVTCDGCIPEYQKILDASAAELKN